MTAVADLSLAPRYVVMFSGGAGSWGAARRIADRHGTDGLVLLFADTRTEDADTYRFVAEAAADIGVPLTTVADGRTTWGVFRDNRFIGNTRVDVCSRVLKREPLARWLAENADAAETTVVLGFDWTELHRWERAQERWKPWSVEAPLTERPYVTKPEILDDLTSRGIETPRLYRLGFPHNNCAGACVKGGQAQWARLLSVDRHRYLAEEAEEEAFRAEVGKDVSILRDRRGRTLVPLTLRAFREQTEAGRLFDPDDWGACSCLEAAA